MSNPRLFRLVPVILQIWEAPLCRLGLSICDKYLLILRPPACSFPALDFVWAKWPHCARMVKIGLLAFYNCKTGKFAPSHQQMLVWKAISKSYFGLGEILLKKTLENISFLIQISISWSHNILPSKRICFSSLWFWLVNIDVNQGSDIVFPKVLMEYGSRRGKNPPRVNGKHPCLHFTSQKLPRVIQLSLGLLPQILFLSRISILCSFTFSEHPDHIVKSFQFNISVSSSHFLYCLICGYFWQ